MENTSSTAYSILLAPAKAGGILQNSGFLDKSDLLKLKYTAKATQPDEISWMKYIENEISSRYKFATADEALFFIKQISRDYFIKYWLSREYHLKANLEAAEARLDSMSSTDIEKMNFKGLAIVAKYDVMFSKCLEVTPAKCRLQLLKKYDSELLSNLAFSGDSALFDLVLALFSDDERVNIIQREETDNKYRLLNYAAFSGDLKVFNTVLALYPENIRFKAIHQKKEDEGGYTLLNLAAGSGNLEVLDTVFALYSEDEQLEAINQEDSGYNGTLLKYAVKSGNLDIFQRVLALYPHSERLAVIKQKQDNESILFHAIRDYAMARYSQGLSYYGDYSNPLLFPISPTYITTRPEMFKTLLAMYPEAKRLKAITQGNLYILHRIAGMGNAQAMKSILTLLPKKQRLSALLEGDDEGNPVLHVAMSSANAQAIIACVLSLLPENDHIGLIEAKNREKETVLHEAARIGNIDAITALLAMVPKSEHLETVQQENTDHETVLHKAAESGNATIIAAILSIYPENKRLEAITRTSSNRDGQRFMPSQLTVIHKAIMSGHLEALQTILSLLPKNQHVDAVQVRTADNISVFHLAASLKDSGILKTILNLFPKHQQLDAIKQVEDKVSMLAFSAHLRSSANFTTILNLYPEKERKAAIDKAIKRDDMLLRAVYFNSPVLITALTAYPEQERLAAMKLLHDKNIMRELATLGQLDTIKAILQLLPISERLLDSTTVSDRLEALFNAHGTEHVSIREREYGERDEYILHTAVRKGDTEFAKAILDLLPENQQITALLLPFKLDMFMPLLNLLPENRHSEVAQLVVATTSYYDKSILLEAVSKNPDIIVPMLKLLPRNQLLEVVQEKDKYGHSVLGELAGKCHFTVLISILELLPESIYFELLKQKYHIGFILHKIASSEDKQHLQTILTMLPETQRWEAILLKNKEGFTVLASAVKTGGKQIFPFILKLFPEHQRLELVQQYAEDSDRTVLNNSCKDYGWEWLIAILNLLPEHQRMEAMRHKKDDWGALDLIRTDKQAEFFPVVLSLLPATERLEAIKKTDNSFWGTVLHQAVRDSNLVFITKVLELLPENQRIDAIQQTSNDLAGNTLLHEAADRYSNNKVAVFKTILAIYPEDERLAAIQQTNKAGKTVQQLAIEKADEDIINFISKIASEAKRAPARLHHLEKLEHVIQQQDVVIKEQSAQLKQQALQLQTQSQQIKQLEEQLQKVISHLNINQGRNQRQGYKMFN